MSEAQRGVNEGWINFAILIGREKTLILGITFFLCVIVAVISLCMTPIYTARTVLLPPQQQNSASSFLDQLGPLAGIASAAAGIKNPSDLYAAFLKSDSVRNRLIEKFGLQARYRAEDLDDTRKELDRRTVVSVEKLSGLISVAVNDEDPKFAADLANAHVEAMQRLLGQLALSDARQRRVFLEEQVDKIAGKPFRDVRVQEVILSTVIRQYEMARIDEAKDGPILQQVDVARAPDRRSKPRRTSMVVVAAVVGLIFGVLAAQVKQVVRYAKTDPDAAPEWRRLKEAWKF